MANMQVISPSLDGTDVAPNLDEDGVTLGAWTDRSSGANVGVVQHKYLNDGRVAIRVVKGATATTLVVASELEVSGLGVEDRDVAVDASSDKVYGPFPPNIHNERGGGDAGYTGIYFSGDITGVEVTVFRLA